MPKRVHLPDGRIVNFPDSMQPAEIQAAMVKLSGGQPTQPTAGIQPWSTKNFLSNAGEMLNPITIGKGLVGAVTPAAFGGVGPVQTISNIAATHSDQFSKASAALGEGRYSEALGHGAASVLPVLGPLAAEAGEQIGSGDWAGGVGKAVGVLAPMGIAPAVRATRAGMRVLPNRVATRLEAGAASRVADVMAPKVGPNKTRFGNMAEAVSPAVAKDLPGQPRMWTRDAIHGHVQTRLMEAETALDAASDTRLAARSFNTKPLIDGLLEKRRALTAEAVTASKVTPKTGISRTGEGTITFTKAGTPIGTDVVPGPNAARVAVIDQAIAELQQLGPVTRYEPIRRIRQAYDGPAKAIYSPSMTADYLKAQGGKLGAADVTGTLRDALAQWDPPTAAANAQYSLWRKANDVLEATVEVERTRPRVGRQIINRLTGTVLGGQTAGAVGAGAGFALGPVVDAGASAGATTQLATARMLGRLATAIRGGDVGHVTSLMSQLRRLGVTASAQVGRLANQVGTQGAIEPARP